MIQNHRFGTGLNKYLPYIPFKDTSLTSDNYFRVLDAPDRLYVGKTSFRLRANLDTLVVGSTIYIDIVDSAGTTIYHEIIDFVGKDESRLIVIHTYENTAPGEATIYIAGRIKYNANTGASIDYNNNPDSWDYLDYPNMIWTKKVVIIPTDQNNDEVLFLKSPDVTCHERTEYFSSAPVSRRKKTIFASGSESVSLQSTVQPYQYSNTSRYSTAYNEGGKYLDLDPSGSQDFIQSQQIQVPEYFGFNTIRSLNLEFNKDMVGGKINIKNPNNLDTEYSASIIKIIDRNTIQVDAPFNFDNGETTINSFLTATNFSASYISRDVTLTTFETESFVQIDLRNLEPAAGAVDKIQVSYKPYGTFGEFIDIGTFPVKEQNYLINSSSLLPDKISIIEQPIGDLSGSYSYGTYWELTSNPLLGLYTSIQDSFTFDRGGSLFYTASSAVTASKTDYLSYFKVKTDYGVNVCSNTEFKLGLSTRYSEQSTYTNILSDYKEQQIDVYISGTAVISDDVHNTKLETLLSTKQFGTYIGSISTLKGITQLDSKLYFKTLDEGKIYPIFVVRSGNGWEFKEITLSPRRELGYSPNQSKLMVPIDTLKTNVELVLKLEYYSNTGKKSDISTTLYGLSFTGTGFPKDRLLSSTGIVSSSQQIADDISGSFSSSLGGKLNRVGDYALSSSQQIATDISGAGSRPSGSSMSVQYKYANQFGGSDTFLFDPTTNRFYLGRFDFSNLSLYPGLFNLYDQGTNNNVIAVHKSGSEEVVFNLMMDANFLTPHIGIGHDAPHGPLDVKAYQEYTDTDFNIITQDHEHAALSVTLDTNLELSTGFYYKILNVVPEWTPSTNVNILGEVDGGGRHYIHLGVETTYGQGIANGATWMKLGNGKLYAPLFSGSGAELTALPYGNISGKPTLLSSSQQIATSISGSWAASSASFSSSISQLSSSLSSSVSLLSSSISEKLNRIGDNVFTASIQVNIDSASYSRYYEVNQLYAAATASSQQIVVQAMIVRWENNPVYDADHPNQWISSSYFKLSEPGTYVVDSIVKIATLTGSVQFYSVEDQNGAGLFTSESLYSGSVNNDNWVRLNYKYITTGSNNRIGFKWNATGGTRIAAETVSDHSYFKITRIYRS